MIEVLISLGCYASFWSHVLGIGTIMQAAFLPLFAIGAVYAVLRKQVCRIAPSFTEILLYGVGAVSSVIALIRSEESSIAYSIVFLATLILISILSRVMLLERLLD